MHTKEPTFKTQNYLMSIIIPIYNREKYIKKAIQSVLFLDRDDVELILVDDASTDNSLQICREFQSDHINIQVIALHQNGGPGDARNAGLEISRGKWIYFLDSDDYLIPENFLHLLDLLIIETNIDIVEIDAVEISEDGKLQGNPNFNNKTHILNTSDYLIEMEVKYVWQYCFRSEYLHHNKIVFTSLFFCEDIIFCFISLLYTKWVKLIPIPVVTHIVGSELSLGDAYGNTFMKNGCNPLGTCCEEIVKHIYRLEIDYQRNKIMRKFEQSKLGQLYAFFVLGRHSRSLYHEEYRRFIDCLQIISNHFEKPLYFAPTGIGSVFGSKLFMSAEHKSITGYCDNKSLDFDDFSTVSFEQISNLDACIILLSVNEMTLLNIEKQLNGYGYVTSYSNKFIRLLSQNLKRD